jgi:hypothetical protein
MAAPFIVAVVASILVYFGVLVLGKATMVIIGGSLAIAYVVWLLTSWRRPLDPKLVTLPYLILIAAELIHMAEEQLTNFPGSLATIFTIPSSFNLVAHAIILMGGVNAVALLALVAIRSSHQLPREIGAFVMWFYVIGPGMVNFVAHVTLPFIAHHWYFSGLITVLLPTVAGIATLIQMLKSDARSRRAAVA